MSVSRVVTAALFVAISSWGMAAPAARPAEGRGKAIDLSYKGQTLEQSSDTQGALQKYLSSVQAAPSPAGYYNLGRLSRISGNTDAATRYLNSALELNPNYEMAKLELTQVK